MFQGFFLLGGKETFGEMVGLDKVTPRGPLQPQPFRDPVIFEAVPSGDKEDI